MVGQTFTLSRKAKKLWCRAEKGRRCAWKRRAQLYIDEILV